ncbi:hypothetical protein PCANC_11153 [Puccinia coronata f. sp. avenae]|uniref:LIM zinc-binding domain-containing protein n=1 Tax=Puccinia coronata f. sp. avenae TaxID=200324 RepID=A0A2N5RUY8_9BASI|nr:hypothetical protein PCANC_28729 [Puccinia coronata f. sp. avenae]PLW40308.1 hypothetical protein PCANC_11153 [Puccinia coronata f. sp. avenae]
MISVLLVILFARQSVGTESEQKLVQISEVTQYAPLAHAHMRSEDGGLRLDAEVLAHPFSFNNPQSSHCHEVAITIDSGTVRGSDAIQAEEDKNIVKPLSGIEQSAPCPAVARLSHSKSVRPHTSNTCAICREKIDSSVISDLPRGKTFCKSHMSGWTNSGRPIKLLLSKVLP